MGINRAGSADVRMPTIPAALSKHIKERRMDLTTLLIIVVVVLLLGGGGFFFRRR